MQSLSERWKTVASTLFSGGQFESSVYWTDKLASLKEKTIADIATHVLCLQSLSQYDRAMSFLKLSGLLSKSKVLKLLMAQCCFMTGRLDEAEQAIEAQMEDVLLDAALPDERNNNEQYKALCQHVDSALLLLLGKVQEGLENRIRAAQAYSQALTANIYCYEALNRLVNGCLLKPDEERELIESLPVEAQTESVEEATAIRFLYTIRLNKYATPRVLDIPSGLETMRENLGVILAQAETHYYNNSFNEAFLLTEKILQQQEMHMDCMPLHISLLTKLKKTSDLFLLAHRLVDLFPENAVAWYAVGSYYYSIGVYEAAKRYLGKCTSMSLSFGPGWLMYGHAFATEREHDQAMNCYMKAAKVMRGCHLPLLYIGLEYSMTNNSRLAERFFHEALAMAPEDPHVLLEIGVLAFRSEDYVVAENNFRKALTILSAVHRNGLPHTWQPLFSNLGHLCRKLKRFDESLEYHFKALLMNPHNAATLGEIGYAYLLTGTLDKAIDFFHKSLSVKRENAFISTLLNKAVELLAENNLPQFLKGVADVPKLTVLNAAEIFRKRNARTSAADAESMLDASSVSSFSADDSKSTDQHSASLMDIEMGE